jgi:hypothetical protein
LQYLPRQAKPKNKKDPTFNTFQTKQKPNLEFKRTIIILEAEREIGLLWKQSDVGEIKSLES